MNHDNVTLALAEAPAFDPHTAAANSASTKSPRPVTAGAFAPSPWAGPRWPPSRPPAPSPSLPRPRHAGERERHGRPPASQPKRDAPVDHIHQPAGQVTRPQRRSRPALTPHPAEHSPAPPNHRRVGRPSTSTHSRENETSALPLSDDAGVSASAEQTPALDDLRASPCVRSTAIFAAAAVERRQRAKFGASSERLLRFVQPDSERQQTLGSSRRIGARLVWPAAFARATLWSGFHHDLAWERCWTARTRPGGPAVCGRWIRLTSLLVWARDATCGRSRLAPWRPALAVAMGSRSDLASALRVGRRYRRRLRVASGARSSR